MLTIVPCLEVCDVYLAWHEAGFHLEDYGTRLKAKRVGWL